MRHPSIDVAGWHDAADEWCRVAIQALIRASECRRMAHVVACEDSSRDIAEHAVYSKLHALDEAWIATMAESLERNAGR
jgi:hypothetical protein